MRKAIAHLWRRLRRGVVSIAFLLVAPCNAALANPTSQDNPDATEAIRQEARAFKEKDLLRVKLRDSSERVGCLKAIESDGLLIGLPNGAEQKVLYGDIASMTREQSKRPSFLRRVVPVAALAGVILAGVKIGSNTPRTVAVKVEVVSGIGMIVGQASSPRVITCR